jgi:hypothetical protein
VTDVSDPVGIDLFSRCQQVNAAAQVGDALNDVRAGAVGCHLIRHR